MTKKKEDIIEAQVIEEQENKALAVRATPPDLAIKPLLEVALSRENSIEAVNSLLEMRRQLKNEWAREEYYKALSELQTEMPPIPKDKVVKNRDGSVRYSFASLDTILETLKPMLKKYGFSVRYETEQRDANTIEVSCVVTHQAGHSEKVKFSAPIGRSGHMLPIQEYGAALTYAKRYTLCMAFGLNTDEDTDAIQDVGDEVQIKTVNTERLKKIWARYLDVCDNVPAHAKNAIKKVVGDTPKEQWTQEQLEALERDIERRRQEKQG